MTQAQPKRVGTCAYCGQVLPLTRDHVPPRSLFPDPKPSDLITVPCCEPCRIGWSADDEYFRLNVISACAGLKDNDVENVNDKLLRSLRKPNKARFALSVRESLRQLEIYSPGGIYLGAAGALVVDKARIDRVAQRIIRGLFFIEKGYPVPIGYEVTNSTRQQGISQILDSLGDIGYAEHRTIGETMFAYTYAATDEDPNTIVWLSMFYERLPFVGFTILPKHLRGAAT